MIVNIFFIKQQQKTKKKKKNLSHQIYPPLDLNT